MKKLTYPFIAIQLMSNRISCKVHLLRFGVFIAIMFCTISLWAGDYVASLSQRQTERILRKTMKKLNNEYLVNKEKECFFVLSQTDYTDGNQRDMLNGILKAHSNITPRSMSVLSGQTYTLDGESSNQPSLESSYLYHVLQLGPMIAGGEYWNRTLTPFIFWPPRRTDDGLIIEYIDNNGVENAIYNRPKFKKRYNIGSEVIQTPNGTEIIKVVMQRSLPPTEAYKDVNMLLPNGKIPAYCILNGTIYIDKKKERLLSFDGELIGFMARMKLEEETTLRPASCHIQIEYTHNNGYTEIEKSRCTVKCEHAETTLSLTNIGPKPFSKKDKCIAILGNLPEAVRQAGYNPALWENEAVKKAIEESTNDHQP